MNEATRDRRSKPRRGEVDRNGNPVRVYRFTSRAPLYRGLGLLTLVGVLAAVASGARAASEHSLGPLVVTGGALLLALVCWTLMSLNVPQQVTLRNSIMEIKRKGKTERFDLVDPNVEILGRDGEMAFRYYDGRVVVVRASDVDWEVFTNVVMHYQNYADTKAVERTQRFSS